MDTSDRKCLIELPRGRESSMVRIGIERIRDYYPGTVDVVHIACDAETRSHYDLVVIMAKPGERAELDAAWGADVPADGDAHLVKCVSADSLVLAVGGVADRGTLFAAYCLADLMKVDADLASVDVLRKPVVPHRYAWADRWTHAWSATYQPTVFSRTLKDLPRYGVNGVSPGLPVTSDLPRYRTFPFDRVGADIVPRDTEVFEWKEMIKEIKAYGYDIWIMVQPYVPPGYDIKDIDTYYRGGPALPGYEDALKTAFREFLATLFEYFPEIDLVEFNTAECSDYWPMKRLFCHPQDPRVCARILDAYLEVLSETCKASGRQGAIGTHCCGIATDGMRAMRETVFRHPDIMLIEDDYCGNNQWLAGPLFGWPPTDLKPGNHAHTNLGIRGITDAEFFGEGRLPSAVPEPLVRSGAAARELNADNYTLRVSHCTGTPHGTSLANINEIMFAAGMAQCWDPVPDLDELWESWTLRRLGAKAAGILLPVFKECEELLTKGFSLQGIDVLWGWCMVSEKWLGQICQEGGHDWLMGEIYGPMHNLYGIFQKPGIPLTPKVEGDNVYSEENGAYQCKSTSMPMSRVQADQERAGELIQKGAAAVEKAGPFLDPDDYKYFSEMYAVADVVLKAVMACSEGAYATHIMLDNFDNVPDPEQQFEKAMAGLLSYADTVEQARGPDFMSGWTGFSLCHVLRTLAEGYRLITQGKEPPVAGFKGAVVTY